MTLDMVLHFLVGMLIYIPCKYIFNWKQTLTIVLCIALGKELWDYFNYGFYPLENLKDIFFTVLGPTLLISIRKEEET